MIERELFREFHTDEEAYEWAMHYFEKWIRDIQPDKTNVDDNSIAYLLYAYAGGMSNLYNQFLRGFKGLDESEIKEHSRDIDIIEKAIRKHELQENTIVYRYTNNKWFGYLFESRKARKGEQFTDKGFMSTTLVPNLLKKFAKEHRYNCVLKLYLPKGTKGAYIRFNDSVLNEHEFLLPTNSTFRLIRKHFSLRYRMVYECELVSQ